MQQFGSRTVITAHTRLILLDCFETLVEMQDQSYRARQGIVAFLTHFGSRVGLPLVVISDADQETVQAALQEAGLERFIVGLYHAGNAMERLPDGRSRKRLDLPLRDFGIPAQEAVFIGDSPLDAEAAAHHQVNFIRVPRSEDRVFTFTSLITGPSRYQSQEFSATFLDRYLNPGASPPVGPAGPAIGEAIRPRPAGPATGRTRPPPRPASGIGDPEAGG